MLQVYCLQAETWSAADQKFSVFEGWSHKRSVDARYNNKKGFTFKNGEVLLWMLWSAGWNGSEESWSIKTLSLSASAAGNLPIDKDTGSGKI